MSVETSFIEAIGIAAAAEATIPTLPNKNANVASWTGWTTIGAVDKGHDVDLDEETVEASFFDEVGEVKAPISLTRADVVNFANGIDAIEFICYDGSEALLALGSDVAVTSNVSTKVITLAKRAVVIEVGGRWLDDFPNCTVQFTQLTAGAKEVGKTAVKIMCCSTSTVPAGWQRHHYQAA